LRELFRHPKELRRIGLEGSLEGKRVAVQGFGNVGYHVAKILRDEDDCQIVAVGEYDGSAYDPAGLDVDALQRHFQEKKTIRGFPGARTLRTGTDALFVDCDIVVPAALENQIRRDNAQRVKARVVAEAANGPVTTEGESVLLKKGVMILPDIFMNAGGVTVSYFEWTKNISHMRYGLMEKRLDAAQRSAMLSATEEVLRIPFPEKIREGLIRGVDEIDLVRSGLEETMVTAFQEILDARSRYRGVTDLRTAAFLVAIEKIGRSYLELGVFP
jgi:glutamate dehydrogenase (NAD(P)+)